MRYCLVDKFVFTCIAFVICAPFWGCKDEPPPKPQVVRKKIALKQKPSAQAPTSKKSAIKTSQPKRKAKVTIAFNPKSDIAKPSLPPKAPTTPSPKKAVAPLEGPVKTQPPMVAMQPKSDIAQPVETAAPSSTITAKSDIATSTIPEPAAKAEPATETVSIPSAPKAEPLKAKQPSDLPSRYVALGKLDPFEPLFKEQVAVPAKRKRRIPRTPLERISLSQLKLVGIILSPKGNRALVQEASGKGYIIKQGTFLGLNSGRVVEITKDTIVIEEEIENILGKLTIQKKEMKLPKPPGDF